MINKWNVPVVITTGLLMLSACGGGSDSGSSEPNPTPSPTAKVTWDFQYKSQKCNITQPAANLVAVIHRQDGSILSQTTTSSAGKLDINWPSDAKHLSVISQANGELMVRTELQVQSGDLGRQTIWLNSLDDQCSCENFTLDLQEVQATYSGYTVYVNDRYPTGTMHTFESCKQDGAYPPVIVTLSPSPGNMGAKAYAAKLDINNQSPSNTIMLQTLAFEGTNNEGQLVNVTPSYDPGNLRYQTFAETDYGRIARLYTSFDPQAFPGLFEHNFIQLSNSDTFEVPPYGSAYLLTQSRKKIIDVNQPLTVPFYDNRAAFLVQVDQMLNAIFGEGSSSYDFTSASNGQAALWVALRGSSAEENLAWEVNGWIKR